MLGDPNVLAYAALLLFIPLTLGLYARMPATKATLVTVLVGVLFLPEVLAIDPPLLPPLNKTSVTGLWAFVGCLWKARSDVRRARPFRGIDLFFVLLLVSNVGTSITNAFPLVTGPVVRPELGLYDAFALGIQDTLTVYLPFFLGRAMFTNGRDAQTLLNGIVVGGVVYAFLALIEIRLSPQLHHWIYGYHQSGFNMTYRFGGYRPMIFMQHGLAVAMFMLTATLAAIVMHRTGRVRMSTVVFLGVVLVLCKSTGAVVYALAVVPVVALVKRPRVRLPAILVVLTLLYPALRTTDTFPTQALLEQAEMISEERAFSLWFRFDQESHLLERALEKPFFGWGGYNRNRVYDPFTGDDLSVTDGDWIIQIGSRGLLGFVTQYALLTIPVLLTWRRIKRIRKRQDRARLAGLALITSLLVVDLLPNGLFNCLPFFFSGAVFGLLHGLLKEQQGTPMSPRRRRRGGGAAAADGAEPLHDADEGEGQAEERYRPAHGARPGQMLEAAS